MKMGIFYHSGILYVKWETGRAEGSVYGQPAVSKWLAGTRPEDPVIRAMAVTLGCDEEWLLNGEAGGRATRRAAGGRR